MDSLRYVLGELDYLGEAYDSALGLHLSIPLPVSGAFRDSMLAQRSRIFDRIWPAPTLDEEEAPGPSLEWEIGSGHSRGYYQAGSLFPYGMRGMGFSTRSWLFNTRANLAWPLSFRGQNGSLGAQASLSPTRTYLDYNVEMQANVYDVLQENLSLSGSAGLSKSEMSEHLATFSLSSSRLMPTKNGNLSVDGGFGGEWKRSGSRRYANSWLGIAQEAFLEGGNSLIFSLNGAMMSRSAEVDWLHAPVLYVDDILRARPTHFLGPDFRDTLLLDRQSDYELYVLNAGEQLLSLHAPQTSFSVTPSLAFGIYLPAGWRVDAATHYGVELYPEYAWDEVPVPDSLGPFSGDFSGLALNRADGRHYAAVLIQEEGRVGEYYGSRPLVQRKGRRVDQRAGLNIGLGRSFRGQTLTLGASAEFGWSTLPRLSPFGSVPWQWGMTCAWTRAWDLP